VFCCELHLPAGFLFFSTGTSFRPTHTPLHLSFSPTVLQFLHIQAPHSLLKTSPEFPRSPASPLPSCLSLYSSLYDKVLPFGLPGQSCSTHCLARSVAGQPDVDLTAGKYALPYLPASLKSPVRRLACFESCGLKTTACPSIVVRQSCNFVAHMFCRSEVCLFT